jgi:stearoyl-CoA desaturase (delta-9 desaturase)
MGVEGDVVTWVADHRKHHQFSDREGDPHSPHAGSATGRSKPSKAFWHAHTGWLFVAVGRADRTRYAKDLVQDRGLRLIAKLFLPTVVVSLAVPALVGWAVIGGWYGLVSGLVWGGAVRIFLLHHVTWSINSICHLWGRRRFESRDESRNVWWLSWLSFGESWHNNPPRIPVVGVPRAASLRDRPRRLGDLDAREMRPRVACRQDSAGAAGGEGGGLKSTHRRR